MSAKMNRRGGFMLVFCLGGSILNTTISLMTTHDNENEQRQVNKNDNKKKMTEARWGICCNEYERGIYVCFLSRGGQY